MTTETTDKVSELHRKLKDCINPVKLGAAGRFVGYDKKLNMFVLFMHTTSPEKTQEATELAFKHIYGTYENQTELGKELQKANIGFAGKQI